MSRSFDDASSQYLFDTTAPITVEPITMACWFYADDDAATGALMSLGDFDGQNVWLLLAHSNDNIYARQYTGGVLAAAGVGSFSIDTWHHACAVYAATDDRKVYLDGGAPGTNTAVGSPSGIDTVTVGSYAYNGSRGRSPFSGRLAEAAMWNVALTANEISMLADGYSPLFVRPQNLVFYPPLVRDNDEDIVGGLSLTAVNSPTVAAHPPMIYPAPPIFYSIPSGEAPADLSIDIGMDESAYQGTGVRIIS